MKLTKRGEYALRTLIRLGIAERRGTEVVTVSTLAESEKLPSAKKSRHADPADGFPAALPDPPLT